MIGPGGVPVTVGIDPVGCCASTEVLARIEYAQNCYPKYRNDPDHNSGSAEHAHFTSLSQNERYDQTDAPINPRPMIKIPITAPEEPGVPASLNSGISSGGGGVKVGMRVCSGLDIESRRQGWVDGGRDRRRGSWRRFHDPKFATRNRHERRIDPTCPPS